MATIIRRVFRFYTDPAKDFRVRVFNVLASVGVAASLVATITCTANGESLLSTLANFSAGLFAVGLMAYASRTGRYQRCYIITIVVIFMVMFPVIYFVGGGHESAMPSFFVFAMVFTAFMLSGRRAIGAVCAELFLYIGVSVAGMLYPHLITPLTSEPVKQIDVIMGFSSAGVGLSISMLLLFRMYNRQQQQLEEERERANQMSRTKTIFLANMSHEIRTPINVMLGMNEMVLRESDSEQVAEYSRSIRDAGNLLLTLISNVLDVSKIEAGKLGLAEEPYRVAGLIDELDLLGREQAARQGLAFAVEVGEGLPTALTGDFLRVKQIALNFISNAVKYTEAGRVGLAFSQKPAGRDGRILLCISVSDTGIGISAEEQRALFGSFVRGQEAARRSIEGSGLGLSIARDLAALMDGQILLESTPGKGSVFTLQVPQHVEDPTPMDAPESASIHAGAGAAGSFICPQGRVLVVDDNRENLQVAASLLQRTLLRVDTAESGAECLAALEQNQYHVVLLDHMMPGMDGLETFARVRQAGYTVPVVALTANAVSGADKQFLQAGFAAYLTKPVAWQQLEETLLQYLPAQLVTRGSAAGQAAPSAKDVARAQALLAGHDIALLPALRRIGDDLPQYGRLAGFFLENAKASREEIKALADAQDWQALAYPVHALKSRARAIGALGLYSVAEGVETHCHAQDGDYISTAMPFLLFQWRLACRGLAAFIEAFPPDSAPPPAVAEAPDTTALLGHIRAYRHSDARAGLERLLASLGGSAPEALHKARAAIEQLDFEQAEAHIQDYLNRQTGEDARHG